MEYKISLSHWGSFKAEVSDGRLIRTKPFPDSGNPSPMVEMWPDLVYSNTRVKQPMIRQGFLDGSNKPARYGVKGRRGDEPFVSVSWEKALNLVAQELSRVRTQSGNESILGGSYGWSSAGRFHHARSQLRRFLFSFGGCVDQVGNYSWGAAQFILPHVLGSYRSVSEEATSWRVIAENSSMVVAFGGLNSKNWQITPGGAGNHILHDLVLNAVKSGVEIVSISPSKDDAPNWMKASWLAPRPNTDTAMMLALAYTIVNEGLHNQEFINRYCVGFEKFMAYLDGKEDGIIKNADWASSITEISALTIKKLARRMASRRTMLTAAWSLQRGDHGEQPFWALIALASVLGQIGLPGGGFSFGYGSMNGVGAAREEILTPCMEGLLNPIDKAIPVARVADLLLNPGKEIEFNGETIKYPDIRLIYWAGGNPFHHHQDLNGLLDIWQQIETIIVHESWWTPTARLADIVLPATTCLERNDIGGSTRDRYIFAMPKIIEPVGEARDDFSILKSLSEILGCEQEFTQGKNELEWLHSIYKGISDKGSTMGVTMPTFDNFWSHGYWLSEKIRENDTLLDEYRADPNANPLGTPSKKIELYSKIIADFNYDDCPPHPAWLEPMEWLGSSKAKTYPFHLITNQPKHRFHGQMDSERLSNKYKINGREPIWMNSLDAKEMGISDGEIVCVSNERGSCLAGAILTDDIRRNVVVIATGAWFDPSSVTERRPLEKHGNPNVLTADKGTSRLAQGCSALSALVKVEKYIGKLPPVTVFTSPESI